MTKSELTATEYHVASYIVQAAAEHINTVKKSLETIEGVEVHGESEQQKLIITIEGSSHHAIANLVEHIKDLIYINSLLQVYHQYMHEEE